MNYIEFILMITDNNIMDKKIASYELKKWFLDNNCRNNSFIRKRATMVCKLFLNNEFIENKTKTEINNYLKNISVF